MSKAIVKIVLLLSLIVCSTTAKGEEREFALPFDFPILLSGNFAELRSNHFHGGVDFKTQGVINKPIHAPADGYISRATVSPGGYGNALYITHYNGYTTVYGHLESFTDDIAARVRERQYSEETFAVDLSFKQDEYPVRRGDIVAMSGNTGYSFGPHLHFEIRETESGELINPLLFYKEYVKDSKAPKAYALSIHPRPGKGCVNGKNRKQVQKIGGNSQKETFRAWGEVGFGIKALDFMDNTANNYGLYTIELRADGKLLYSSRMDRVAFNENRLINAWVDYEAYYLRGEWFMRSHLLDNNPLRLLSTDNSRGWLTIDEERTYDIEYTLSDIHGNTSRYRFAVKGERCEIPDVDSQGAQYFRWDTDNELRDLGMRLKIPKGELFEDAILDIRRIEKPDAISDRYNLNGITYPLWRGCEIAIQLKGTPSVNTEKLYIRRVTSGGGYGIGGSCKDGWISASISSLGIYEAAIDTTPPTVRDLTKGKNGILTFYIADGETGVKSYKGYIDGEFKLFKFSSKNVRLTCNLKNEGVRRGRHTLRLVVTDRAGNETIHEKRFTY